MSPSHVRIGRPLVAVVGDPLLDWDVVGRVERCRERVLAAGTGRGLLAGPLVGHRAQDRDAQVMQRRAAGLASSRAGPMGLPHDSQRP